MLYDTFSEQFPTKIEKRYLSAYPESTYHMFLRDPQITSLNPECRHSLPTSAHIPAHHRGRGRTRAGRCLVLPRPVSNTGTTGHQTEALTPTPTQIQQPAGRQGRALESVDPSHQINISRESPAIFCLELVK